MGTLDTIVPYILLLIGIIWLWSTFHEPAKKFFEWIKGFFSSNRDRFQQRVGGMTELQYS